MNFWKLISNLKHYRTSVALSILFNILMAVFMVVNIPLFIPLLETVFRPESVSVQPPTAPLSFGTAIQYFTYHFNTFISQFSRQKAVGILTFFIVISFFFKNLFRYLALYFIAPVRTGIIRDLRAKLYRKLIVLPMGFFNDQRKGDIMSRLTGDIQEVEWSILNVIESIFREPLVLIGSLVFMLMISWKLTLFVLVLILFTGVIIGGISRKLRQQSGEAQSTLGQILSILEETLSGLRVIKGFRAKQYLEGIFDRRNERYRSVLTRVLRRKDLSSPLSEFLGITIVAVLIWYGSGLVLSGEMTAGTFFAFLFAFYNVIDPVKSFSTAYYSIQKGLAALERIDKVLSQPEESDSPHAQAFHTFQKAVTFQGVSYTYPGTTSEVLHDINIALPRGKTLALVGSSGAGKTTLVDLLFRFYDIEEGEIRLDDVPISHLRLDDLRSQMAIVTQHPILFNDTVYNNIAFGRPTTPQEVQKAAEIANAHDFIQKLEHGYQSNIGDGGQKLSGGQRQRLTIARAILKNPSILVLDEATSALDAESERLVQNALEQVMRDRTSIVIAHRLSTIQRADIIAVMKEGRIIQQGTHESLLREEGEYRRFVSLQSL